MKFSTIALGVYAALVSGGTAHPSNPELDERIICIGCINTGENTGWCREKSDPPNCEIDCKTTCIYGPGGCRCCPVENNEIVGECSDAN